MTKQLLQKENEELKNLVSVYKDTLEAIRAGAVDALIVSDEQGEKIYSLQSTDYNYRVMVESMNEGTVTLDKDGIIIFANRAFSVLAGREMPVLVGIPFDNLMPIALHTMFSSFLTECAGKPQRTEFAIVGTNGCTTPVALSGTNFIVGGRCNTCLIVRDLSERKNAEQKLQNAYKEVEKKVIERTMKLQLQDEKIKLNSVALTIANKNLEAKTRDLTIVNHELESFNYSVSHDLRNPLHAIVACAAVLSRTKKDMNADAQKALEYINKTTERMSQVIRDLLALSGISRKDMSVANVSLSNLAQEFMNTLKGSNPQNSAEIIIAPGITTDADEGLARILIENLLRNAWKFSSKTARARIEFGTMYVKGKMVCFIRDNGVGFDMALVGQIFEPFKRLHSHKDFPGNGIGLAIVKMVTERHGGVVWAESEPGKGATFYFTLQPTSRR